MCVSSCSTIRGSVLCGCRSVDLGVRRGFLASCRLRRLALNVVFHGGDVIFFFFVFLKHLVRVDNGLEIWFHKKCSDCFCYGFALIFFVVCHRAFSQSFVKLAFGRNVSNLERFRWPP